MHLRLGHFFWGFMAQDAGRFLGGLMSIERSFYA